MSSDLDGTLTQFFKVTAFLKSNISKTVNLRDKGLTELSELYLRQVKSS